MKFMSLTVVLSVDVVLLVVVLFRCVQEFVGAVGLNKIARYHLDPRAKRTDEEYYELIGDDAGIFGCMTLLGFEGVCPKDLPLQSKIAYLRRMMLKTSIKN